MSIAYYHVGMQSLALRRGGGGGEGAQNPIRPSLSFRDKSILLYPTK